MSQQLFWYRKLRLLVGSIQNFVIELMLKYSFFWLRIQCFSDLLVSEPPFQISNFEVT